MLEFLKKIFQSEEREAKTAEISLQNLKEWLNEKSKPLMEEVRRQTEEILMKVNEEVEKARFNVEVLENAKLQNPNIPFKAKQYMEGNRKAYIRSINSFLGHMEINNKDYFYLVDFCRLFDGMLNDLNKGTLRSYTILQEFFANETGRIAQNLKNFDAIFAGLESILNGEKIVAVNNVAEKVNSLSAKTRQKINLSIDFKSMEAAAKLASGEKDAIMAEIEKFNKSEQHNNFLRLNEEKKTKTASFYNDENQILQSFSVLERPLRKYSHVAFEHEEMVLDYLKQPIETLVNDKNLMVLEILENLKKTLEENKLQIDGRKKERSMEEIKRLSREFIGQFLNRYFSFKSEMEEIERKIRLSGVPEKFRDFNRQLEETNLRVEKNSEEFEKMGNDVAKLESSIENLKNEIENEVKEAFGEDIKIIT